MIIRLQLSGIFFTEKEIKKEHGEREKKRNGNNLRIKLFFNICHYVSCTRMYIVYVFFVSICSLKDM